MSYLPTIETINPYYSVNSKTCQYETKLQTVEVLLIDEDAGTMRVRGKGKEGSHITWDMAIPNE